MRFAQRLQGTLMCLFQAGEKRKQHLIIKTTAVQPVRFPQKTSFPHSKNREHFRPLRQLKNGAIHIKEEELESTRGRVEDTTAAIESSQDENDMT